jgi:hypothetical protein
MKHSPWMMAACVALVVAAVALVGAGVGSAALLFLIPCMVMMGAMIWMMTRGSGG